MFSRFFIDRPIFATVLSIFITLLGGLSVSTLPLAQFPNVSPPTVSVTCSYPGASAQDVSDAVASPIEQQVNGVERMMYMSSSCTNDGNYSLTVTFEPGVDLNMAQVLVQNRVSLALPSLPDVIKQTGVTARKRAPDVLMGFALTSSGRYSQLDLSNYALIQVRDELLRVKGVSDVMMLGQRDYSMRIWIEPDKLAVHYLTAADVASALREQNMALAAGSIGQEPMPRGQTRQVPLDVKGRLTTPEEFEKIIVKVAPDGRLTRIKDIGWVQLGAKNEDISVHFDGKETIFMAVFQMPDANALEVHDQLLDKMADLARSFPQGIDYEIAFDTTPYTRESINEVFKTLRDAIILVAIVVLLFLQNWRSAIIPLIAVPVAIIGTFAAMQVAGFSLNNLTLFGLVLAIGIVVDDAIVVVEAVEHFIEHGLPPREATIKAMQEVSGPVIAVGLVLSAVFIPCMFISGITGQFFRQFALTIAVSTVISAFNSLTLSPALTALLLRPREQSTEPLPRLAFAVAGGWLGWAQAGPYLEPLFVRVQSWLPASGQAALPWLAVGLAAVGGAAAGWLLGAALNRLLALFFRVFNALFAFSTNVYTGIVGLSLRMSTLVLMLYGGLLTYTYLLYTKTPRGFIPSQDMGYLLVNVQLPDSASAERTEAVLRKVEAIASKVPGIQHVTGIRGQSFVLNANGSNFGSMFIGLADYSERRDPDRSSDVIANKLRGAFGKISEASLAVFGPPPVRGAGRAGGFAIMIEDRGAVGSEVLQKQVEEIVRVASNPKLTNELAQQSGLAQEGEKKDWALLGTFSVFRANVPQLRIDPDKRECMAKGVSLRDFADTLRICEGSLYVNDFNLFGRTWQVIVQADPRSRDDISDVPRLKVRNRDGAMIPLGSLSNVRQVNGPLVLTRYNMYPAASINGGAGPGMSSGEAIDLMQKIAETSLAREMAYEWTDMSYLELLSGNTAMWIFALAVFMVLLVLAALYESTSLPLAVILVVPMCLLSAIAGVNIAHMDINIFTQIGFVVLVGLASKNAILIVEFAKKERESGVPRTEATLAACKLRLRPIIMTSLAFILGVLPLMIAEGAGAEMRRTLGTAVFSGMLGVTIFGIFLTPVFFFVINRLGDSSFFAGSEMRIFRRIVLYTLTLGLLLGVDLVRIVVRGLRGRREERQIVFPEDHGPPLEIPASNGHAAASLPANGAAYGSADGTAGEPAAAAEPQPSDVLEHK